MKLVHTTPAQPQRPRAGSSALVWSVTIAAAVAAAFALAPMSWGPALKAHAGTGAHPPRSAAGAPSMDLAVGAAAAPIEERDADLRQPIEAYDASGRSVAAYDH